MTGPVRRVMNGISCTNGYASWRDERCSVILYERWEPSITYFEYISTYLIEHSIC